MFEAYLAAWIGICAAQASPGPNLAAVASAGLAQGRRAALLVVSGVASGVLIWAAAVAYGLGALFGTLPIILTLLKFLGGLYLLFLSYKAFASLWRGETATVGASTGHVTDFQAWRRGLLVVMTNPKAALMWSAVATFLFGAGMTTEQVLAFGPIAALTATAIYGAYAILFSTGLAARTYSRWASGVEAAFGATFGMLGATLVGASIKDIRP